MYLYTTILTDHQQIDSYILTKHNRMTAVDSWLYTNKVSWHLKDKSKNRKLSKSQKSKL